MTSSAIRRLVDSARTHLPSAMDGIILLELFNVCKEFTQRSNAWQDIIQITAAPHTYEIALTTNAASELINRLLWLEGKRQDVAVPDSGSREVGYIINPGTSSTILRTPFPPSQSETWYAHVALTVADPTGSDAVPILPNWIIEKYHRALLDGVLEGMMSQPAKPYSNVQGAQLHGRRFREAIGLARSEATHGFSQARNTWCFPQGFRTGSQRM